MFMDVPDLLNASELARLRQIAGSAQFIDGRITNPHSKVKDNTQLNYSDGLFLESSRMFIAALQRSEVFRNFAFPRTMAPPMLTKYGPGKRYGVHADAAFLQVGERPLRSDISCTIFVSPPEAYEGGALRITLGSRDVEIRGAAGAAIFYPSNTLHEVAPVTAGERIVGLTFIESRVADPAHREILYNLNEVAALEGLSMSWENYSRLSYVQSCLTRLWFDPG
jgi:PKHD-type hydroxylase